MKIKNRRFHQKRFLEKKETKDILNNALNEINKFNEILISSINSGNNALSSLARIICKSSFLN